MHTMTSYSTCWYTFSLMMSVLTAQQIPDMEMTSLHKLYNCTSGDNWQWRDEEEAGAVWNFTLDVEGNFADNPCSSSSGTTWNQTWQGVTCSQTPQVCSSQTCHITEINLASFELMGFIPPDIESLTFLSILNLQSNQLTGSIPSELGNLTLLEQLRLHTNQLSGSLPSSVGQLTALEQFVAYLNQLNGTIPSSVGKLSVLQQLHLSNNQLMGTIPSSIEQLTALRWLYLHVNELTGYIPYHMGKLTALEIVFLHANQLTGSIPRSVGNLLALKELALYSNHLNGTIPSSVGNLTALAEIYLYDNELSGSIPSSVGKLLSLHELVFNNNELTGDIPYEIGQLTALVALHLYDNQLTGNIATCVENLLNLEQLILYNNQLTGTIPDAIGQLTALSLLFLYGNQLTGTIPNEVVKLTALEGLYLDANQLTGTIPNEIGQLITLQALYFSMNQLTGPLPNSVGQLTALSILHLYINQLSGTIPSSVGQLTALEMLYLYSNQLTGTIPSTIGYLVSTYEFWLHDNYFGGALPVQLSKMLRLESLFLQNNILTGHIQSSFNHSTQLELTTIDLSNNLVSGSISTEIFQLPHLEVLSLSVNCFGGELSQSLCSAARIEVLSLNGLQAAEGCEGRFVIPLSGVGLSNAVGGTVPVCVWHLRNLSVLHLTGNGLSGELIRTLPAHSQIADLSLSHNQLSGTIPLDILNIESLDLSYNQLTGEYADRTQYQSDSSINLEVNRLSGQLPVSELERVSNITLRILKGNLFSCNTIPDNDEYSRDYVCGSRNWNSSLYVFMSAFIVAAVLLMIPAILARFSSEKQHWLVADLQSKGDLIWTYMTYIRNLDTNGVKCPPSVRKIAMLSAAFVEIMHYAIKLLVLIVVGSMALYLVKALDFEDAYATHSHTYAWFWTLAYIRGVVPAGLLLMVWAAVISACFYRIIVFSRMNRDSSETPQKIVSSDITADDIGVSFKDQIFPVSAAFCFNACITIVVNTLYIVSTQQTLGPIVHFCCQLSLSIFRIIYVVVAFPFLSRSIQSAVENVRFRFIMLTINNLLIPCIVTALTSEACFQGLLIPADAVSTPYSYRTCEEFTRNPDGETFCSNYATVVVDSAPLVPPFAYNNQCGSVLLTAYIPVFLLGYSIQLLLPFVILLSLIHIPYDSMSRSVREVFNGILWPQYWLQGGEMSIQNKALASGNPYVMLNIQSIFCNDVFNNWLLLLTFGLCSPVLAFAVACSVLLKMALWVFLIGRFTRCLVNGHRHNRSDHIPVASSVSTSSPFPHFNPIKSSTDNVAESTVHFALVALAQTHIPLFAVLAKSFWRLVWCSALFVALLSWDMAIDEVGWLQSLWVPLAPFGYVIVLRCVAYYFCSSSSSSSSSGSSSKKDIESESVRKATVSQQSSSSAVDIATSQNPLHLS